MKNLIEKFTRKRLEEISTSFPIRDELSLAETEALAQIALAVMDYSPIGVVYIDPEDGEKAVGWIEEPWDMPVGTKLYTTPPADSVPNYPVIPDGWKLVPIEPTEDMVVNGFESEPDESFSDPAIWDAYQDMSGCEQAAERARLCWAAMLAAAPAPEAK
ncbi:hypothetical protein GKQ23_10745 [Erwinia sp. E602]|uniref:hypothetical protein n=1 Tax=Erwinia sp. E602 TaxID=2675378 RepID=UPI001BAA331A|nr:hypothetical protein [Erwinia sp. E602]QUG75433.1 hypothetical protein GKQ23_10745 [Erwinia sp. E602]